MIRIYYCYLNGKFVRKFSNIDALSKYVNSLFKIGQLKNMPCIDLKIMELEKNIPYTKIICGRGNKTCLKKL